MSHVEFGGFGLPIPESADVSVLDPHLRPDLPMQTLVLVDGQPFHKVDWVSLGYNQYEVWCVGGAGGQGGNASRKYYWNENINTDMPEPMPSNVFTAWKEMMLYDGVSSRTQYFRDSYWHTYVAGETPPPAGTIEWMDWKQFGGWLIYTNWYTFDQYANFAASHADWMYDGWNYWKAHQNMPPVGWRRYMGLPQLMDEGAAIGGGGGGGGVQVVSGKLADLPDVVPVSVGKAGADAPVGHLLSNGPFTPSTSMLPLLSQNAERENVTRINPQLWEATYRAWTDNYALPHPSFYPPAAGEDGGASAFGDICMASGGKGGGPSVIWVSGQPKFFAHGGDGGKGGTLVAGGGGQGSIVEGSGVDLWPLPGKGGTWDGAIGTGGGGGRGGSSAQSYKYMYTLADGNTYSVHNLYGGASQDFSVIHNRNASEGGWGAYSKLDTSVYGEGSPIQSMVTPTVYGGSLAHSAGGGSASLTQQTQDIVPILQMFPGVGGGARVNRKYRFGSYRSKMDPSWSPNGLVLLRLSKIDDD